MDFVGVWMKVMGMDLGSKLLLRRMPLLDISGPSKFEYFILDLAQITIFLQEFTKHLELNHKSLKHHLNMNIPFSPLQTPPNTFTQLIVPLKQSKATKFSHQKANFHRGRKIFVVLEPEVYVCPLNFPEDFLLFQDLEIC
jgi:hypothetical protein